MEERVLPPGGIERTYLRYERCAEALHCGDPGCLENGRCFAGGRPMLWCGACGGGLIIIGPLTAPLGVQCKECGGTGLQVQGYDEPVEDPDLKVPGRLYYSPETKKLEVWE